jgi:ATP/ADP translocase
VPSSVLTSATKNGWFSAPKTPTNLRLMDLQSTVSVQMVEVMVTSHMILLIPSGSDRESLQVGSRSGHGRKVLGSSAAVVVGCVRVALVGTMVVVAVGATVIVVVIGVVVAFGDTAVAVTVVLMTLPVVLLAGADSTATIPFNRNLPYDSLTVGVLFGAVYAMMLYSASKLSTLDASRNTVMIPLDPSASSSRLAKRTFALLTPSKAYRFWNTILFLNDRSFTTSTVSLDECEVS